jgi:hypothetical protein
MGKHSQTDECAVCGMVEPHEHTDLKWDDDWGLIPGPNDQIIRADKSE